MKFINKHEKWLLIFFVVVILIQFSFHAFRMYTGENARFDPKKWEDKFNKSQWVVPNSQNEISDEDLFIHIGYKLAQGGDPALFSAEVPPLGKYLIGFFSVATGNTVTYGVFFSALLLVLFFMLNKLLFKHSVLSILPVVFLSFDPIFIDQIGHSMLDAQYLSFLLLMFIFLLKKKYLVSAAFAGLFMATKSPFLIVVVYVTLFSYLFLLKELSWKRLVLMPMITGLFYLLTHLQLFILGHDLRYFLSVQNFMLHYYQTGAKGVFGAVIPLIVSGYWFTWFDQDRFIKEWTILWPTVSILTLLATYKISKQRLFTSPYFFLVLWCVFYLGFLCLTPVFPRYLLLLLPFLYNLSIWVLFPNSDSK